MSLNFSFYLSIFFRRFPVFFITATLFSVSAISVAILLPTVYEAEARLLVESPHIPNELAASTVQTHASEQLEIFEQRLMTRVNLLGIARRLNVFDAQGSMSPDQIVREMHRDTSIKRYGGRDQATIMTLAFEATSPEVAAQVVNSYMTLILEENVQFRTERAGETLDFFEQEVERLGAALDQQSSQILDFKNKNSSALPDGLDYRMERQSSLQERLTQLEREKTSLANQRVRLVQIYKATGSVQTLSRQQQTTEQLQLAKVQDELSQALIVYSEQNPRVKALQARVDQLEEIVRAQGPTSDPTDPNASLLDVQLSEIDDHIQMLDDQIMIVSEELKTLQRSIDQTPTNAITLEALERDYSNIQAQYNAAVDRLSKAVTGERIELSSKGQRFTVIEQATVPTEPERPNRPLIAGGGVLFAIIAGIGCVVLLEMMNRSVRRPVDLEKSLGITPLASLPYIRTSREKIFRRSVISLATLLVVAGVPAMLYLIHTTYLPLDLIWDKVLDRFGL